MRNEISLDSRLAVSRLGLGTISRFRLLTKYCFDVRFLAPQIKNSRRAVFDFAGAQGIVPHILNAGMVGIEPTVTVLETVGLPLTDIPILNVMGLETSVLPLNDAPDAHLSGEFYFFK